MTDELVENVRQAIWDALRNAHGFDASLVPKERTDITALATAALAVLRQHLVPRATGDDGELVGELRAFREYCIHVKDMDADNSPGLAAIDQAADRITALSAEVAALKPMADAYKRGAKQIVTEFIGAKP